MKEKVLLIVFIFVHSLLFGQDKKVKILFHHKTYYDIIVIEDGKKTNLTDFDKWEEIRDLKISKDRKYFFFRHKPDKGKAFKLVVYDFENLSEMGEITPGFGGSFEWNELNQIIHSWGCGTNCSNLKVYDLFLEEIFFTLSSGGFELSPKKDLVVQFNMHGDRFWIFDLKTIEEETIQVFSEKKGFNKSGDQRNFLVWSLKFFEDYKFQIFPPRNSGSTETLDYEVDQLKFSRLKFKDFEDFYERK